MWRSSAVGLLSKTKTGPNGNEERKVDVQCIAMMRRASERALKLEMQTDHDEYVFQLKDNLCPFAALASSCFVDLAEHA